MACDSALNVVVTLLFGVSCRNARRVGDNKETEMFPPQTEMNDVRGSVEGHALE